MKAIKTWKVYIRLEEKGIFKMFQLLDSDITEEQKQDIRDYLNELRALPEWKDRIDSIGDNYRRNRMKAVFITDKPSSCLECEFCGYISDIENIRSCMLLGHHAFANADEEYRICPLKPLPKLKQHKEEIDYEYGYIDGWNACIDAITGEKND